MLFCTTRFYLIRFFVILFISVFVLGCPAAFIQPPMPPSAPTLPDDPDAVLENTEQFLRTPVELDSYKEALLNISKKDRIAIMDFEQQEGSGSGTLVSDQFVLELQRRGYRVVDRDRLEQVLREQDIVGQDRTNLSDIEIAKRIGRILHADYFMFGAVTEFRSENRNISVPRTIPIAEKERYKNDYHKYVQDFEQYKVEYENYNRKYREYRTGVTVALGVPQPQANVEKPEDLPEAKSLEKWEQLYSTNTETIFARVANVGLTAKLIEMKSTKVVWVGNTNVMDVDLRSGMKRIVNSMLSDIFGSSPSSMPVSEADRTGLGDK